MTSTRDSASQPWASGPGEILRHGLSLLSRDSDTNRRLALIAIDNAVELMIKTFLGLPKRITGLSIPRREYQEMAESFPALLDGLERHAEARLAGVDLGAIEWYHRLRNQLYHQGNGLTVERDKVDVYAEMANGLFKSLFGFDLVQEPVGPSNLLGKFLESWNRLEAVMIATATKENLERRRPRSLTEAARQLEAARYIGDVDVRDLLQIAQLRNRVVHGEVSPAEVITEQEQCRIEGWIRVFSK